MSERPPLGPFAHRWGSSDALRRAAVARPFAHRKVGRVPAGRGGSAASVRGMTPTLSTIERLELAAESDAGVRFVGSSMIDERGPVVVTWREIHDDARAVGAALQAKGLVPGDHVAILGPTSRELMTIVRGCWMAGLASMVLPLPMRMGSLDSFIESTRSRIRHGDAKLVLIDDQLADFYVAAAGDPPIAPMRSVIPGAPNVPSGDALELPSHDPERLVILQYTSGSTSEPKGVMIPDRVLSANIDACCEAAELAPGDVMVSWLPLYHDMGLVGLSRPAHDEGCRPRAGRPAGLPRPPGKLDAVAVRLPRHGHRRAELLVGARHPRAQADARPRPVEADAGAVGRRTGRSRTRSTRSWPRRHDSGSAPGSVFPAFGMAEVAIGGAFPPRGRGLRTDVVDRYALETQRVAKPVDHDVDDLDVSRAGAAAARQGGARPGDDGRRSRLVRAGARAPRR